MMSSSVASSKNLSSRLDRRVQGEKHQRKERRRRRPRRTTTDLTMTVSRNPSSTLPVCVCMVILMTCKHWTGMTAAAAITTTTTTGLAFVSHASTKRATRTLGSSRTLPPFRVPKSSHKMGRISLHSTKSSSALNSNSNDTTNDESTPDSLTATTTETTNAVSLNDLGPEKELQTLQHQQSSPSSLRPTSQRKKDREPTKLQKIFRTIDLFWSYSTIFLGTLLTAGLFLNLCGYGYTVSAKEGIRIDTIQRLREEHQFQKAASLMTSDNALDRQHQRQKQQQQQQFYQMSKHNGPDSVGINDE